MSVNDTLGDGLTRIRNGQMARLPMVGLIYSKMVVALCGIMQDEGYITSFDVQSDRRSILVKLRYTTDGVPVIRSIKRISKPGCRVYVSKDKIGVFYRGLGIKVLSTSKGVMQSYKAKKIGVGGEALCSLF